MALFTIQNEFRYDIVRKIFEGGMGVVYEAEQRGARDFVKRVAIKVVRPEVLADPGAHDRFRREARAAARVNHPHICALYEYDEADGQPFLVMELLSGESLAKRLERGALPCARAQWGRLAASDEGPGRTRGPWSALSPWASTAASSDGGTSERVSPRLTLSGAAATSVRDRIRGLQ